MLVQKCPRSHSGVFPSSSSSLCVCCVLCWVVRVQSELLYGVNNKLADKISNFNRYDIMLYRRLCGSQESNRRRHHTNFAIDKQYNTDSFNLTIALPSLSRALLSLFISIYISCLFPQSQFAEPAGYFSSTSFEELVLNAKEPITFADSVTGKRRQRDTHLVPTYSSILERNTRMNRTTNH